MNTNFKNIILATRPRSLPAFVSTVLVAICFIKYQVNIFNWKYSLLAVLTALFLQIGLNLINDYSEGKTGIDAIKDDGHFSGHSSNKIIFYVSLASFLIVSIAGVWLILLSKTYWLLIVGFLCLCAGLFYTWGFKYGYIYGLGTVAAFIFPGPVAFLGTLYTQNKLKVAVGKPDMTQYLEFLRQNMVAGKGIVSMRDFMMTATHSLWTPSAFILAAIFGLLSCIMLLNDEIRDIDIDKKFNKRTLAVLIGDAWARRIYAYEVAVAFILVVIAGFYTHKIWFGLIAFLLYAYIIKLITFDKVADRKLLKTLNLTGLAELLFAIILCIAFLV